MGYVIVPWSSPPFLKLLRLKFKKFQEGLLEKTNLHNLHRLHMSPSCNLFALRSLVRCSSGWTNPTPTAHSAMQLHQSHLFFPNLMSEKNIYLLSELLLLQQQQPPPSTRSTKKTYINSQHNHQKKSATSTQPQAIDDQLTAFTGSPKQCSKLNFSDPGICRSRDSSAQALSRHDPGSVGICWEVCWAITKHISSIMNNCFKVSMRCLWRYR